MPTPLRYRASFAHEGFYHLLFRSNGGTLLFESDTNRLFFLEKFALFLKPFMDCWSWNLLDNHAHFVVRIKSAAEIKKGILQYPPLRQTRLMREYLIGNNVNRILGAMLERQINSFMASYTLSVNKVKCRKGGLFQSPFRRNQILDDKHLQQAIVYVHANAQKHGIVKKFWKYPHSSYIDILQGDDRWVKVKDVLAFFGGKEAFSEMHREWGDKFYPDDFE